MELRCGIDLGGTKIEGVLMSMTGSDFDILERLRVPTEKEKGYDHILGQICLVVKLLEERSGLKIKFLGIGTPGVLDPSSQTMKNCNTVCLIGRPLKKDLERRLGISVQMANDANCFALAEATLGAVPDASPDARVVFGVIMGTGVGGGLVVDGNLIHGRHGIAGEWGHNYLDSSGGECYCGKQGCVETLISGIGLEQYYEELKGEKRSLKTIAELFKAGEDPIAQQTMERLVSFFGKAISVVINLVDPDVIVLGGGVGNVEILYDAGIDSIRKHIFNDRVETVLLKPKLGDSAGVFGAAMLNRSWQV